jgi:hypothetical protein
MSISREIKILLVFMLFVGFNQLQAQISGTVGYSIYYSNNPFRINDGTEEYVNSLLTSLHIQPLEYLPVLSYSFDLNSFKNYSDRSYSNHSINLDYSFMLLDTAHGKNISLGVQYIKKNNPSGEGIYKYNSIGFNGLSKFFLTDRLAFISGYSFNYKNYPSLYNLTYKDNLIFARLSAFFKTKTSLHFEISIGNRKYSIKQESIFEPIPPLPDGNGEFESLQPATPVVVQNLIETSVTQLHAILKVSQSLSSETGINLFYRFNRNLNHNTSINHTEFMYSDDEDLWDDPYGYEGGDVGSTLTRILPYDITFKLSGEYSKRKYIENIVDSVMLKQRYDSRTELWLGFSKDFDNLPFLESLTSDILFMHSINNSNERFFSYKNNALIIKILFNF